MDYIKISQREKELLDAQRAIVRKLLADDNPGPEFLSGWLSNLAKVQEALDALSVPGAEAPSEQKHTAEPWIMNVTKKFINCKGLALTNEAGNVLIAEVNHDLADKGINEYCANAERIVACVNACAGMENPAAEITKLREFKAYVHSRMDDMGIEREPNGLHSLEGCRIGDRLDIVQRMLEPNLAEVYQEAVMDKIAKECATLALETMLKTATEGKGQLWWNRLGLLKHFRDFGIEYRCIYRDGGNWKMHMAPPTWNDVGGYWDNNPSAGISLLVNMDYTGTDKDSLVVLRGGGE